MFNEIYAILSQNALENGLSFPVWIYNVENVRVKDRRYLKVYLFNRNFNLQPISEISFDHNGTEHTVRNFEVISSYGNPNVVGCLIQIQPDDLTRDLTIVKEIVGNKEYADAGDAVVYHEDPKDQNDLAYLHRKLGIEQYPVIGDKYWKCSCGRLNGEGSTCLCGKDQMSVMNVYDFDIEKSRIEDFLNAHPFQFDLDKSFAENMGAYEDLFLRENPNIDIEKLRDTLDLERIEADYNEALGSRNTRNRKMKRSRNVILLLCMLALVAITTVFYVYNFTGKNGIYNKANRLFRKGEYTEARELFASLGDYKTSEDMVVECDYQNAVISFQKDKTGTGTIAQLEKLGKYKDSEDMLNQAKYQYVKDHYNNDDTRTYAYLKDLVKINYSNAKSLYSNLYDWRVVIYAISNSEDDLATYKTSFNYSEGIIYWHIRLEGGAPGEVFEGVYGSMKMLDGRTDIIDNDILVGCVEGDTAWFWQNWWGDYRTGTAVLDIYTKSGKYLVSSTVTIR